MLSGYIRPHWARDWIPWKWTFYVPTDLGTNPQDLSVYSVLLLSSSRNGVNTCFLQVFLLPIPSPLQAQLEPWKWPFSPLPIQCSQSVFPHFDIPTQCASFWRHPRSPCSHLSLHMTARTGSEMGSARHNRGHSERNIKRHMLASRGPPSITSKFWVLSNTPAFQTLISYGVYCSAHRKGMPLCVQSQHVCQPS